LIRDGSYIVWICNTAPSLPFLGREKRDEADMVVMKFGFAMQHRLLSLGEEEGRRGCEVQPSPPWRGEFRK
jgi:hypothetical protein